MPQAAVPYSKYMDKAGKIFLFFILCLLFKYAIVLFYELLHRSTNPDIMNA